MKKILAGIVLLLYSLGAAGQVSIGEGIKGNTLLAPQINENGISARYPLAPNQIPGYQSTLDRWHVWNLGLTTVSSLVSQWNDQGPNARHITQGTASNRPALYYDNTLNCNGNKVLSAASYTFTQPLTYYARFRQIYPWTASKYLIDGNTLNSGAVFQNTATPQLVLYAGTNPAVRVSANLTAWQAGAWVLNGASSSSQLYGGSVVSGNSGTNNPGGFNLCGAGGGNGFITADVREVATFNVAHSAATKARILAYFNMVGPAPSKVMIADGDSQTVGFSLAETSSYPAQLRTLLGSGWEVVNYGVNSAQCSAMEADAATQIDTWNVAEHTVVGVSIWCGTNDLFFGATAATTITRLTTYGTNRKATGEKVIMTTMLSRSDATTPASYNTDRATVNTAIRAGVGTIADCINDIAADHRIGDDGDELDTTYFQADKVHLNATGLAIVAAGVDACKTSLGL